MTILLQLKSLEKTVTKLEKFEYQGLTRRITILKKRSLNSILLMHN